MLVDTLLSTVEDTIFTTDVLVEPHYEITIDTMVPYGEPYFHDTTLVFALTATNGCDSIVIFNVDVTVNASETILENTSFVIRPNPTAGLLVGYFKNATPVVESISLWSVEGKELERFPVGRTLPLGHPLQLDIGKYPSGVYWIKVLTGKGMVVRKVVRSER
jgi:hypothetical protein